MDTPKEVFEAAMNEVKNLKPGEIFIVKDLFVGYKWNRLAPSVRKQVGSLFFNMIDYEEFKMEALEKTSANQQKYRKL